LLVELGLHSSGLSVNGEAERFQRFPLENDIADITNSVIEGVEDDFAGETRAQVAATTDDDDRPGSGRDGAEGRENAVRGLVEALGAVEEAARRAAENARAGDRGNADRTLEAVATRLDRVETRLAEARGSIPETVANANDNRLDQAQRADEL